MWKTIKNMCQKCGNLTIDDLDKQIRQKNK